LGVVQDITDRKTVELTLQHNNQLLSAISAAQTQFITEADPGILFDNLLETLLQLTESEYGFIGEILYNTEGQVYIDESYMKMRGRPYLKTKAITDISWNEETRRLYDENTATGMEFHNLKTLFGRVILTGQPVISNNPKTDPRRGGLPAGHPPLNAFLGIPFYRGTQLMGMIGIANRPGGYTEAIIADVEPFLTTCASTIEAYRNDARRKQAEEALQASEAQYRRIVETANEGIWILDANHQTSFVNPKMAEMLGYTTDEMMGKTLFDFMDEVGVALAKQNLERRRHGVTEQHDFKFQHKHGADVWVWISTNPVLDDKGQYIGTLGMITNITERRQAEQALQQLNEELELRVQQRTQDLIDSQIQLQTQEQFLRSIYEGVQQPIFVGDVLPDQTVRVVGGNPITLKLAGKSLEEVAGKSLEEVFSPEIAAEIQIRYDQCIAARQPVTFEECITFQGQTRWMLSTYNPLIDAEGRVHRVVGTVYDITERKQLEQELRQINSELEQRVEERTQDLQQAVKAAQAANHAKTIFLSNMSHELRTPLNAILGFSQLLNRDSNLTSTQQEQIDIINRNGEHLLGLINDVLAMSKIEAGRITLSVSRFNLRQLLRDLEDLFRLKAEAKRVALVVQISPTVPTLIQTDESKLRQVLINLLGNAIKFTTQGSVTLRVWPEESQAIEVIAQSQSSLCLHFEVEDTGCGIDPDEQSLVFEPFKQTQSGRNSQEGTGLGLPISRQFVQLMGGELNFTSLPNRGTVFRFTILVETVERSGESAEQAYPKVIGLAAGQPSYRLLVVEDNPDNRLFLMRLLCSVGFEVQTAVDGQEAITCWQTWKPHLVWMDMRMPVMDGYRATQQIRRLEQQTAQNSRDLQQPTKILALTASAFEDEQAAILAAGCDDLLFKPVTEAALFEKILQHLSVRYIYQNSPYQDSTTSQTITDLTSDAWLTQQELQRMPSEWVSQLQYAARLADEDLILKVIHQLPSSEAKLADTLKNWVSLFQFEKLIEITGTHQDI
jgi:PAS domain S-box-containing protein